MITPMMMAKPLAMALLLLFATPFAAKQPDEAARLLTELKKADDPTRAKTLREKLQRLWIEQGPISAQVLLKEAARAQADGLVDTARALLDLVVKRWPDYAEGRFRRAFLLWQLNETESALAETDAILRRMPAHFPALVLKVRILLMAKREKEALRACKRLLAEYPHWQEMRQRCARIRWRLEQET